MQLALFRDGKNETVDVKLAELQDESKAALPGKAPVAQSDIGTLGLSVSPAAEELAAPGGLAIIEIKPDGKAADVGLVKGDILLKANGADLRSAEALETALRSAKAAEARSMRLPLCSAAARKSMLRCRRT